MSANAETINSLGSKADNRGLGGQPRGLTTLFFTEMWERFSFYGMRALLMIYMTSEISKGGFGWKNEDAAPIYALYASSVYFLPLIGGWIADRFIGAKKATLIGGIIIMLGHFLLAFSPLPFFYAGLIFVATGTGFLKSNISKMVGDLYDKDDERRDGGFSIFYMGINLGAFLAPLIVGALAAYKWHWGFAAAGVGMALGLIQYIFGWNRIKNIGLPPAPKAENEPSDFSIAYIAEMAILIGVAVISIYFFGTPLMPTVAVASLIAVVLTGVQDGLTLDDWKRLAIIFVLFTFSMLFWMGFEQAGSSFSLFAEQITNRTLPPFIFPVIDWIQTTIGSLFGYNSLEPIREFPAAWFQSVNSGFLVLLAPVFAWIWLKMGKRQPSDQIKFVIALIFGGLGFIVVAYASSVSGLGKVSPWWLVLVYLLHTIGELCLSPVGLSSMTKLAPVKMISLMLGVWFLSISMGNYVAGMIAGEFEPTPDVLVGIFTKVAMILIGGAVVLAIITPFVKKLYTAETEVKVESH